MSCGTVEQDPNHGFYSAVAGVVFFVCVISTEVDIDIAAFFFFFLKLGKRINLCGG